MAENRIQESVKMLAAMWNEQDKKVCAEEVRKWIQPHIPQIMEILSKKETSDLIKKISADAFPDGEWQGAVALNQIVFLGKLAENPERAESILKKFSEAWDRQPLNLSAFLIEWRRRAIESNLDPEIVLDTIDYDPSKQSYFDPEISRDGTKFFMNMYKNEFDLDVDALSDSAARVVDDELLEDFFRLVDIDMPMDPEAFVKRVEMAVEILNTAKEQGMDVKAVFRKWDELADEGGERLEKLPAAVKAIAEETIRERFWDEMGEHIQELKLPIIDGGANTADLLATMHALGLIRIKEGEIEFEKDVDAILSNVLEILLKANPSAIYTTADIVDVVMLILRESKDRKNAVATAEVMASLDVPTLRRILDTDTVGYVATAVEKTVSRGMVKKEELIEALRETVPEAGEDKNVFIQKVMNEIHKVKER